MLAPDMVFAGDILAPDVLSSDFLAPDVLTPDIMAPYKAIMTDSPWLGSGDN